MAPNPISEEAIRVYLDSILKPHLRIHASLLDEKIFNFTCSMLAKAFFKLDPTLQNVPLCLCNISELVYAFVSLSHASQSMLDYMYTLSSLSQLDSGTVPIEVIKDAQKLTLSKLGGIDYQVLQLVMSFSEHSEYGFQRGDGDGDGDGNGDIGFDIVRPIIREVADLFYKIGKRRTDVDLFDENPLNNLSSLVQKLFEHPIAELNNICAFLPHFPGFEIIVNLLKIMTPQTIKYYLLQGLSAENPSEYVESSLKSHLVSRNSPWAPPFPWVRQLVAGDSVEAVHPADCTLRILMETVSLINKHTRDDDFSYGSIEYLKTVTAVSNAKIDHISGKLTEDLVLDFDRDYVLKCKQVLNKSLHCMVGFHNFIKSLFVSMREEMSGTFDLDLASFDAILHMVAYVNQLKVELDIREHALAKEFEDCQKIYRGTTASNELKKSYHSFREQLEQWFTSVTQGCTYMKMYMPPQSHPDFLVLTSLVRVFETVGSDLSLKKW